MKNIQKTATSVAKSIKDKYLILFLSILFCFTFFTPYLIEIFSDYQNKFLWEWNILHLKFVNLIDFLFTYLDPSLFQTVILGGLTILIPFMIALLQGEIRKKEKKDKECAESNFKQDNTFDIHVLIEHVFKTRRLFCCSVVSLLLLSFFYNSNLIMDVKIRFISLLIFLIGVLPIKNAFFDIIKYVKGERNDFILEYLKIRNFKINQDNKHIEGYWQEYWKNFSQNEYLKKDFFNELIRQVDSAIENKNIVFAVSLARTYFDNIREQRVNIFGRNVLLKVLEWHDRLYEMQKVHHRLINQKRESPYMEFYEWDVFKDFLETLTEEMLVHQGVGASYYFYKIFKEYVSEKVSEIEELKREVIDIDIELKRKEYHFKSLFNSFLNVIYKNNNLKAGTLINDIDFPREWKITVGNISNKDEKIRYIVLIAKESILDHINSNLKKQIVTKNTEDYDSHLDSVFSDIFPEADPITLSSLIYYMFLRNDLELLIKTQKTFGYISHIVVFDYIEGSDQMQGFMQQQQEGAYELFIILFNLGCHNLEKFKADRDELKILKDKAKDKRDKKRAERYVYHLGGLIDKIERTNKPG